MIEQLAVAAGASEQRCILRRVKFDVHDSVVDFDPGKPGAIFDEECARRARETPFMPMPMPMPTPNMASPKP